MERNKTENLKNGTTNICSKINEKSGREKRGITLVALIITIVVMLILVAVTVSVVINSNLIGTAQNAADATKQAYEQEGSLSTITIGGKEYNSIEEYMNRPKVGDYVNYTPAGTAYITKYTDSVEQKYSGYTENQDVYLQDTKWRILNINSDGSIDLISEKHLYIGSASGNSTSLYFKGATGYNNGVELLNDICDKLYGTGTKVTGARNLNIEDIQEKMDTSVWNWTSYENSAGYTVNETATYQTSNAYYPARWAQETAGNVNGSSTNGTLGQSDEGTLIAWDTAEKKGLTYFPEDTTGASITVTNTYWYKTGWSGTNFTDPTYYNLLITHEDGTNFNNWLASRYVSAVSDYVGFGLRKVYNDDVGGYGLFGSPNFPGAEDCGLRPVVFLEPNAEMTKDEVNSTEDVTYWNYT